MRSNIRIVLVNTTHPGNIGGVARAMKNMCLDRLYLVQPEKFPCAEATARASGADDVLAGAVVCDSLDEALRGCSFVVGTSARIRSLRWPLLDPRRCADKVRNEAEAAEVAVVFGREHSGLTNEELEKCHYLVQVPSNPEYSSLNLAAAVQVIAYELMMAYLDTEKADPSEEVEEFATQDEMESFFGHLQSTLVELGFLDPNHPKLLMRRLRRLFVRARPDKKELNILRGMLSAIEGKKLHKKN